VLELTYGDDVTLTGFVPHTADTPVGSPDTENETLPVKPYWLTPETSTDDSEPWPTLAVDEAPTVKVGDLTLTATVVEAVSAPDVPVIVTVPEPTGAVLLAVKVSVEDDVTGFGEKEAVTPDGRLVAVSVTLPLNPFSCKISKKELVVLPCPTETGEVVNKSNFGPMMVSPSFVVVVMPPETPVMVTDVTVAVAVASAVRVSTLPTLVDV
jgi:hypothetical protein